MQLILISLGTKPGTPPRERKLFGRSEEVFGPEPEPKEFGTKEFDTRMKERLHRKYGDVFNENIDSSDATIGEVDERWK